MREKYDKASFVAYFIFVCPVNTDGTQRTKNRKKNKGTEGYFLNLNLFTCPESDKSSV